MKKALFLYLFIFAVLMNIFTYMYFTKKDLSDNYENKINSKRMKDSINLVSNQLSDANYFSLDYNQNAQNYFVADLSQQGIDYKELIPQATETLLSLNDNPAGNPYTGQEKIGAQKFIINKVRVLNHRWIIADFSDGEYWGEVLLKYFVNDDKTLSFEVMQSLLYQKSE